MLASTIEMHREDRNLTASCGIWHGRRSRPIVLDLRATSTSKAASHIRYTRPYKGPCVRTTSCPSPEVVLFSCREFPKKEE